MSILCNERWKGIDKLHELIHAVGDMNENQKNSNKASLWNPLEKYMPYYFPQKTNTVGLYSVYYTKRSTEPLST